MRSAALAAVLLTPGLAFGPGVARAGDVRTAPPPEIRAWQTGMLRSDRLEHASLSWTLGLGIGLASREPAAAIGGTALLGLAKEIFDRHHSGFDAVDLAADLVGGGAAALATTAWRR